MHDGAPSHFRNDVQAYLDEKYRNEWIGCGMSYTMAFNDEQLRERIEDS